MSQQNQNDRREESSRAGVGPKGVAARPEEARAGDARAGDARPGHDSLLRNIGEFVGHVVKGIAEPVATPRVVRETVQEHVHEAPGGEKLVLRRRVIDEVEVLKPGENGPPS